MSTDPLRRLVAGLVIALSLWSCDAPTAPQDVPAEELPAQEAAVAQVTQDSPLASVEGDVTIGTVVIEDDAETLPEGGGDGLGPESLPFVNIHAPANTAAGRPFTFDVQVLSLAGPSTYKVVVFPNYTGPGIYNTLEWTGTIGNTTRSFTVPADWVPRGTFRIVASVTNVNGRTKERKDVSVLRARPHFPATRILPLTKVAGDTTEVDLLMEKPSQPGDPDYDLPLTVDFGDGRTESYTWRIVEEWAAAYKTIPMVWERPGTYVVTFRVATSAAPAFSSSKTETITITNNPDRHYIEDFQITEPVVQGAPARFSFRASGQGGNPLTVKASFGTSATQASSVYPGGTFEGEYTWVAPGTHTVRVILSDGVHPDTLTRTVSVKVPRPPPTIDDLVFPETSVWGAPASFSFVPNDATENTRLHTTVVYLLDGSTKSVEHRDPPAGQKLTYTVPTQLHPATYQVKIILYSDLSGLVYRVESDTTLTVVFPPCPAGQYRQGATCVDAPPGSYAPGQGSGLLPCPAGSYQPASGSASCHLAQAGFFATGPGATAQTPCPAGSFSAATGQAACDPAPLGGYVSGTGQSSYQTCAPGTYQDQVGQTSCKPAPSGSFVDASAATQATLCPAGTFQPTPGSQSCIPAELGHYATGPGATNSKGCAPGTYAATTGQAACDPAPLGGYVGSPNRSSYEICNPGSYAGVVGSRHCTLAEAGRYVAEAGSSSSEPCAPGTFSAGIGATSCTKAAPGSYIALYGATAATPCPAGTWQDQAGASECNLALPGTFVAQPGSTGYEQCAAGTYQPLSGQASCLPAPAGTFVADAGASAAVACAPGSYQGAAGSTGCDPASPGFIAPESGMSAQIACPVGTYQSEAGQVTCLVAPIGTYVDQVAATQATACPAGTSTMAAGSSSSADCISFGAIVEETISNATTDGSLTPVGGGTRAVRDFERWVNDVQDAIARIESAGRGNSGCSLLRKALQYADGNPSPEDTVTGPARAAVAAAIEAALRENGC